jgi:pSer/pThr/pTyr-binding forkhead associated (FHA) protein
MARLCFVNESADPMELMDRAITLGRDSGNTIAITNPGISKHHALLIRDGHDYKLFDLHSANGTWVNGERISVAKLNDGDTARFGPVELRYEGAPVKKTTVGLRKPKLTGAEATVAAPKPLALPSDQPVVAPKKLGIDQPAGQTPRIRLKRD